MAQLIQPILDTFKALLLDMELGDLKPWAEVKSAGVNYNFPFAAVEPGKTVFDPSQDQSAAQAHAVVIQIGVSGGDPESVKTACVAYAAAVWNAIGAWPMNQWPSPAVPGMQVKEVFVAAIEYSTTYAGAGGFSRYVDLTCAVSVEEYP